MKPGTILSAATLLGSSLSTGTPLSAQAISQVSTPDLQWPLGESTNASNVTQPRVWHGTNGYAEAIGKRCTATYNGKEITGTLYSTPLTRSDDLPAGQGDLLDDLFVSNVPDNMLHSYFKPRIEGIPFGNHDPTWAYGGLLSLGTKEEPLVPFTKEQLEDADFLSQHKHQIVSGTYWGTPYIGPCPPPYDSKSKCYEELEAPITLTGAVQEFVGRSKNGYPMSLEPMTIEYVGSLPPVEVAMLPRNLERSCAFKTQKMEDGSFRLSDPQMVATNHYDITTDPESGEKQYVSDVWLYDLVQGGEGSSAKGQECSI